MDGVPRALNVPKLVSSATLGILDGRLGETFHKDIYFLAPGAWVRFEERGTHTEVYWTLRYRPEIAPSSSEEALEGVRGIVFRSVADRLTRTTGVTLSGGLDSGAVAVAAARLAADRGFRLPVFCVVAEPGSQAPDERPFLQDYERDERLEVHHVAASGGGPFDGIEDPERFVSTPLRSSRSYLLAAMEDAARERGVDRLMLGGGGEEGVTTWGEGMFAEWLLTFRWATLARELILRRRLGGKPFKQLARDLVAIRPSRPPRPNLQIFVRRELDAHAGRVVRVGGSVGHRATRIESYRRWSAQRSRLVFAEQRIPFVTPLLDWRVLECALAAPARLKVRDGYQRYLIRAALDGMLPRNVQWRVGKTAFAPDYAVRYNAQLPKAIEIAESIRPSDPVREILDIDSLRRALRTPAVGDGNGITLTRVPHTFYAIAFLRQFAEFRV